MTATDEHSQAEKRPQSGMLAPIRARMAGPGGYYNIGNVIALTAGLTLQVAALSTEGGVLQVIVGYLVGSPGSTALTIAILIFMISGEFYHRAWAAGTEPDVHLTRLGDLSSAIGAAVLTIALALFGDVFMAIISGTLLAGGKLASGICRPGVTSRTGLKWQNRFRWAVFISRAPAIAALTVQFYRVVSGNPATASLPDILMPVVMVICYFIWARADYLLLRPGGA